MARAALPGRLIWQLGRVVELTKETPRTTSIVIELPNGFRHRAGQHVDVRLTAEDGYEAQRSYSIASGPEDEYLVLTVERLEDGEVSPYLVEELRSGDELELRGPIGGYFVWEESLGGPLFMLAGGSGVVPFRSILRHGAAIDSTVARRLLYSSRSLPEVIYHDELLGLAGDDLVDIEFALTREWPEDWDGHRGRVDPEVLERFAWPPGARPLIYICGPSTFVEVMAQALVDQGHEPGRIRTERFGPTGT
jgi:ferredoxin-NADP reductase